MRAGNPNPPGRHRGDRRQLRGAPISSSSGRQGPGALSEGALQSAGRERTRGARRRGGLGAPGRRAGRSSDSRLPCGSRVPGAGMRGGRAAGTQRRRDDAAAGAAPREEPPRTIDPGGPAAARARGRRFGAVPCPGARAGRERRGAPPGARGASTVLADPSPRGRQERVARSSPRAPRRARGAGG